MSPVPKTPKSGSNLEQPHVASPWCASSGICWVRLSSDALPCCPPAIAAKDCHLHKRPFPSPAPLGCACFGVSVCAFPPRLAASSRAPGQQLCVRVVSSSTRTVSVSKELSPCGTSRAVPAAPQLCPRLHAVGRGLSLPLLSCKEEGKCQGQQHETDPTPAAVRGPKLVTCWGL